MIKVYLKQAWQLLGHNKLYSSIYIIGTGMALAMTMTIALIYYVKIAPIYPEGNRNRTLVMQGATVKYLDNDGMNSSYLSYNFVKDYLLPLETPEAITSIYQTFNEYPLVELASGQEPLPITVKLVDDKFWKVFTLNFIDGKPFTEADFDSGIRTAVISTALSNKLFGSTKAEGKHFKLDGNEYRVSGVVENVSFVTPNTYADVWVPFTINPNATRTSDWGEGFLGEMDTYILAKSSTDFHKIKEEVDEVVRKINASQEKYEFNVLNQPIPHWQNVFRKYTSMEIDWREVFKTLGVMLLALLIVPAVNLAGLVSSRMEKRLPEMGIRKSFGASRAALLNQILVENLLFTLIGGVVGLVISYIIMYSSSSWILTIFDNWPEMAPEDAQLFFKSSMLFNPVVFIIAFGVCFILNFMSAIIPAYRGLKKTIIYSLSSDK